MTRYFFYVLILGNTTVDELMMRLMGAMEIFTAQQQEDIKDEVSFQDDQDANSKYILRPCVNTLKKHPMSWLPRIELTFLINDWNSFIVNSASVAQKGSPDTLPCATVRQRQFPVCFCLISLFLTFSFSAVSG